MCGALAGDIQTLFASVLAPRLEIAMVRREMETYDGGHIAVDCVDERRPAGTPVVMVLHGHTGGSESPYVRRLLQAASEGGWRACCYNFRGWGESDISTPHISFAGDSQDVSAVLEHVAAQCPGSPVVAVGFSLGANTIVKYLGEAGDDVHRTNLVGAVAVCNPWDMLSVDDGLRTPRMRFYEKAVMLDLKKYFSRHRTRLAAFEHLDLSEVERASSPREWDQALTCQVYGFKSFRDYYAYCSSSMYLPTVKVPLVCIQSGDDPLVGLSMVPLAACRHNEHVVLCVTRTGGHLGFAEGNWPTGKVWIDRAVCEVANHLFRHGDLDAIRSHHRSHLGSHSKGPKVPNLPGHGKRREGKGTRVRQRSRSMSNKK